MVGSAYNLVTNTDYILDIIVFLINFNPLKILIFFHAALSIFLLKQLVKSCISPLFSMLAIYLNYPPAVSVINHFK